MEFHYLKILNKREKNAKMRGQSLIFKIATTMIIVTFLIVILWYLVVGTIITQVINNPSGIGETLGEWLGELSEGFKSGNK